MAADFSAVSLLPSSSPQAGLPTHSCLLQSSTSEPSFPLLNHTPSVTWYRVSFQLTLMGQSIQKNLISGILSAKARKQQKEQPPTGLHTPPAQFTKIKKNQIHSLQSNTDINPSGGCLISPHRNLITQLTTHQGGEIHLSLDAQRKQVLLLKSGSSDILEIYIYNHHFHGTVR